jgi:hypothetical protein
MLSIHVSQPITSSSFMRWLQSTGSWAANRLLGQTGKKGQKSKLKVQNRHKSARSARQKLSCKKEAKSARKSARNPQSARNIFCPPTDFQNRQKFAYLAVKTAIWQRCLFVSCQCWRSPAEQARNNLKASAHSSYRSEIDFYYKTMYNRL